MSIKHLYIIVLYNKKLSESETLKNFVTSCQPQGKIIIVNNGPHSININDSSFYDNLKSIYNVEFHEFLENKSLSSIYNLFINDNMDFDYFTILDDDSSFSHIDFYNRINGSYFDLLLPSIIDGKNNEKHYPLINEKVSKRKNLSNEVDLRSISSGLTISKKVIEIFIHEYNNVFDERFFLYGVDTSFFKRLSLINKNLMFVIVNDLSINHSLSRVSGGAISDFRFKERLYDELLINKHYNNDLLKRNIYFLRVFYKVIRRKKISWITDMLKVICTGSHPKAIYK